MALSNLKILLRLIYFLLFPTMEMKIKNIFYYPIAKIYETINLNYAKKLLYAF